EQGRPAPEWNLRRDRLEGRQRNIIDLFEHPPEITLPLGAAAEQRGVVVFVLELAEANDRFCDGGHSALPEVLPIGEPSVGYGEILGVCRGALPLIGGFLIEPDHAKARLSQRLINGLINRRIR